jgi:DNA-binding CsgD family transcriptional regulator
VSLAQLHDYAAAYPSLMQRLPAITAWVKAQYATVAIAPENPPLAAAEALGLTAAEARLAMFLVYGGTTAQYAERHRLSRHTVRNQLQAIFAKLGVNRQADLVRLLIGT